VDPPIYPEEKGNNRGGFMSRMKANKDSEDEAPYASTYQDKSEYISPAQNTNTPLPKYGLKSKNKLPVYSDEETSDKGNVHNNDSEAAEEISPVHVDSNRAGKMTIPQSRPNNPFLKKNLTESKALSPEDTESELGSEGMNDILSKYKKKLNK
jgi:hypothetical protein